MSLAARLLLLGPYVLLLVVFFTTPLLLMLAISLSPQSFGQLEWALTLRHYIRFFSDAYYLSVLADTLWLGALTTVASLLLGYPLAYHLALTRSRWKPLLIVFILSPLLALAAQSLGAHPVRAFFEITLGVIKPGVVAGGIFAFAIGVALVLVLGIAHFMGLEEFTGF